MSSPPPLLKDPAKATRSGPLARRSKAWRFAKQWLPPAVGLALLVVSGWVLGGVLTKYRLDELWAEVRTIGYADLWWSVCFTALSFSALVGYEQLAMRFAKRSVGFWTAALGAFTAQAISHTTGFAAVIATSLRYRVYAPKGLDLFDVAKVQAFFVFTFCLGLLTLSGAVLTIEPQFPARVVPLPLWAWRLLGIAALLAIAFYLTWSGRTRHPLRVGGQEILPPRPSVSVIQLIFSFIDLGAGAAALWVLLPENLDLSFVALLGMFIAAVILGILSHVPGALGVFESTMLLQIGASAEMTPAVLGALLVYRVIYYLLPFAVACILYGVHEADRLRTFVRHASGRSAGWMARFAPGAAAAGVALVVLVVLLLRTP